VHLGAADLAVVALTASLAAIGAPAIPSAGLVTMLIVLQVGALQAGVLQVGALQAGVLQVGALLAGFGRRCLGDQRPRRRGASLQDSVARMWSVW
jgi:Na+/H+-dicarboxylate symporter